MTTGTDVGKTETSRPGSVLTWTLSLVACAYSLWMGAALFLSTRAFVNIYSSLGVELSFSTRTLFGFYRILYPVLFGGAATLVIAKQYFVRDRWANISVTLGTALAADFVRNMIFSSLYWPILDLMEKLSK